MIKAFKNSLNSIVHGEHFIKLFNNRVLSQFQNKNYTAVILGFGEGSDIDQKTLGQLNFLVDIEPIDPKNILTMPDATYYPIQFDLNGLGSSSSNADHSIELLIEYFTGEKKLQSLKLGNNVADYIYSSLNLTLTTPPHAKTHIEKNIFQQMRYLCIFHQLAEMTRILKPNGLLSISYHAKLGARINRTTEPKFFLVKKENAREAIKILSDSSAYLDHRFSLRKILISSGYFKPLTDDWISQAQKKILVKDVSTDNSSEAWLIRCLALQRTDKPINVQDFEMMKQTNLFLAHLELFPDNLNASENYPMSLKTFTEFAARTSQNLEPKDSNEEIKEVIEYWNKNLLFILDTANPFAKLIRTEFLKHLKKYKKVRNARFQTEVKKWMKFLKRA